MQPPGALVLGLISPQAIHRRSFCNVREWAHRIDGYVTRYNTHNRPSVWAATADSILAEFERLGKMTNGTEH